MKCEFRGKNPIFFEDIALGQAFRYRKEMFFAIEEIWSKGVGEVMNAISLEDGRLVTFDSSDEITPCRLVGYFEPAPLGE